MCRGALEKRGGDLTCGAVAENSIEEPSDGKEKNGRAWQRRRREDKRYAPMSIGKVWNRDVMFFKKGDKKWKQEESR